ncbi:MAG: hypothetical protein AN487_19175 [Anabaena sp. CRKS33]|nr:MAG: hypothetical protein AN487_19175 [Anabaena sp. CRKS33]
MDITWLVNLLAPYLPVLLGLGKQAVGKGSEKLGEKAAEQIWNQLSPQVEAKAAAKEAVEDVAKNPDDTDALASLRIQLKKILEHPENKILAEEIVKILEDTKPTTKEGSNHTTVNANDNSVIGSVGHSNTVTQNIGIKPSP